MKVTKTIQTLFAITLAMFALTGAAQAQGSRPDIDKDDDIIYIDGTNGADFCSIYIDGDEVEVVVWYFDSRRNRWRDVDSDYDIDDVDRIVFEGFAGSDSIWNATDIPLEAYGGLGDDWLNGGGGDDDLNGGAGYDSLVGNDGNDILQPGDGVEDERETIGGDGMDTFLIPYDFFLGNGIFQTVRSSIYTSDYDPTEDIETLFLGFNLYPWL